MGDMYEREAKVVSDSAIDGKNCGNWSRGSPPSEDISIKYCIQCIMDDRRLVFSCCKAG